MSSAKPELLPFNAEWDIVAVFPELLLLFEKHIEYRKIELHD
jgi:hypothetical protein